MTKPVITMTLTMLALAGAAYYVAHGSGRVLKGSKTARADSSVVRVTAASGTPMPSTPALTNVSNSTSTPAPVSPVRAGEVLEFAADVAKLTNVANLRLQTVERRDFYGKNAWHLQAFARTENPLRMVFELDDQFDSYSDTATLSSLQYEMHLNERGQKQDSIQRLKTTQSERSAPNVTETRVVPGTRDPLGFMQYLRTVDWAKTREVRSPVYDGHKLYNVTAKLAGTTEKVAVPAGSFSASKLEIHVFDPDGEPKDAELKDAHFALYLANNPSRLPVLLEAVMPFATARVALAKTK